MASYTRMRSCAAVAIVLLLLQASQAAVSGESSSSSATEAKTLDMRKLLNISGGQPPIAGRRWTEAERMEPGSCSEENVVLYQSREEHLPSGIPAYSVEIINVCAACTVYDVHVSCGEFASTELVDPSQFQRVGFNDCLVRRGGPLGPSDAVSFQYSNSFAYPLAVANFACE